MGVPSAAIMTEQFVSAAQLMSQVLGAPDYPFVTIDHPISSAGEADLAARAVLAADACVRLIGGSH